MIVRVVGASVPSGDDGQGVDLQLLQRDDVVPQAGQATA